MKYKIVLFILFFSSQIYSQNCDWSVLNDANENYKLGNFEEIITQIQSCINTGFDDKQKIEGYRLLSKTYLALDNDSSAGKAADELLKINSKFQPDYLADPPKFIQIINRIKEIGRAQIVTSVSKKEENINEAPATAILMSDKQLRNRGYLDLEAFLHDLPGFDISRSNGNLYSHIYQRGYRSINTNRTLFLIDGVEENDLWSNNVYLSRQYAMSNIKNIEVIYGPASTMYGSNAFLGVINIKTKEPQDFIQPGKRFGINARVGYGSYNTMFFDGTFAAGTKDNKIALSVTARLFYSNEQDLSEYSEHDYKPIELTDTLSQQYHSSLDITDDALATQFLTTNPTSGTFYNQDGNNDIILTNAGIAQALAFDNDVYDKVSFADKTEAFSVDVKLKLYDFLIGWTSWRKAEGPGSQYNDIMFMSFEQGQGWRPNHNYLYVKYEKDITPKLNISNFLRYKIHDFNNDNCIVRYRKNYLSGNFSLDNLINNDVPTWDSLYLFQKSNQLRNEMKVVYSPFNRIDIVGGFEARFSSIQGDYTFGKTNDVQVSGSPLTEIPGGNQFFSRDLGLYVQSGVGILKNLNLTLGIRYDYNRIRENQGYGHVFNPRIALVYKPGSFIIKAIYAEAFKDANNREKYSTAPGKRELSNPDLEPEKVKNIEGSVGRKFWDNLFINIVGYQSIYSNIIQEVQVLREDGTLTNQNQAKGQARIFGINAMVDWKTDNLSVYGNYTFTLPYILKPTDSEGNSLVDSDSIPYDKLRIGDKNKIR